MDVIGRWLSGMLMVLALWAGQAVAQDRAWVQIEARPTLREAEARARAHAARLPAVNGFRLSSGWYAIALGPFPAQEATARLQAWLAAGAVPGDSYVVDGSAFGQRFWPAGMAPLTVEVIPEAPEPEAQVGETPAQARAAEAALDAPTRRLVQEALQWEGFYGGTIDGAFGPGTRSAISAWQEAEGHEPTGVLTTAQRMDLVEGFRTAQDRLDLGTVRDEAAGIAITLPRALVAFDRYDPPFAHYGPRDGSGVEALLISQKGNAETLAALYRAMQSLPEVPAEGPRTLTGDSFTLTARNDARAAYAHATLSDGLIRGFALFWEEGAGNMGPVLAAMDQSFAPFGSHTLEDAGPAPSEELRQALQQGLDPAQPARSGTGFYVDAEGRLITAAALVQGCTRVTLDAGVPAQVDAADPELGVALLVPEQPLRPQSVAALRSTAPALEDPITAAGFSFGDLMSLPALSFGTVAAVAGEEPRHRLALESLPGDVGAPLLDASGAVVGMVLPQAEGRLLPPDVTFALPADVIANRFGIAPAGVAGDPLTPAELARRAGGMTALVSCWN